MDEATRRAKRAAYMREWSALNRAKVRAAKREAYQRGAGDPPEPRPCQWCGFVYTPSQRDGKRPSVYCSRQCKNGARNAAAKAKVDAAKPERVCPWCGDPLPRSMRADAVFCSDECNSLAHVKTRRYRRRLGQDEKRRDTEPLVSQWSLGERDGWVCALCGEKVNRRRKHPDPLSPSIDHIVPVVVALAAGWSPEEANAEANLQVTHLRCNLSKRHRGGDQLRLL